MNKKQADAASGLIWCAFMILYIITGATLFHFKFDTFGYAVCIIAFGWFIVADAIVPSVRELLLIEEDDEPKKD